MNPKLAHIFARRSVRRYRPGDVSDSALRDMLEAAMAAPSACAKDPWHFVVFRSADTRRAVADGLPNGRLLADAAVGIAVCGDPAGAHDRQLSYLLQDCSAAIENILLAAAALGLGACWLGVHPREERIVHVRAILGIPADILPIAVLAVGLPGETPPPRTRYSDRTVHMERW